MLKLKITFMLLLTLFCCVFIGYSENDSDELVPTVRLISGGKGEGTKHLPTAYRYSLEIDEPLDHNLVIAIRIRMYEREKTVLGFDTLCLIKKGSISTGNYRESANVFATKVVITLLPSEDRLRQHENGVLVPIRDSAFRGFDADEKIELEDIVIYTPPGYDFKPYNIGISSQISFHFDN
jgi:hypothetical protein